MNAGLVVIILLVGLSILGIPIFLSLGIATAIGVQMLGLPFVMIPQKMFTGMDSSALMAIPFFILAGNIMSRSITGKLINVSDALIGWIKGSLGIVTVLASALFGAISGSAVATVSAVGGITIPAMKKQGYGAPFASAVASMASVLGPLVPPSITLIVYASITEISVSKLFISSVIPALILVTFLIVYMLWYGKKHDLPANERKSGKEIWITIKKSIWALLMPVIIMGTIFGGICTATESAVISVIYAIVISVFVYRDMKWSELPKLIIDAGISTATIMVLVGLSKASSYVVTTSRLPQLVSTTFTSITDSKILDPGAGECALPDPGHADGGQFRRYHDDPHSAAAGEGLRCRSHPVRHDHVPEPLHRPDDAACRPESAAGQQDRRLQDRGFH